jgi:hypothetical protein
LRVFGAECSYKLKHKEGKFEPRACTGRFIGYGDESGFKAYIIWDAELGCARPSAGIVISRDVSFREGPIVQAMQRSAFCPDAPLDADTSAHNVSDQWELPRSPCRQPKLPAPNIVLLDTAPSNHYTNLDVESMAEDATDNAGNPPAAPGTNANPPLQNHHQDVDIPVRPSTPEQHPARPPRPPTPAQPLCIEPTHIREGSYDQDLIQIRPNPALEYYQAGSKIPF